jgi:hypothetical protein
MLGALQSTFREFAFLPKGGDALSKPVFQCSKIMKCNDEAKNFACSSYTKPLQAYIGQIT